MVFDVPGDSETPSTYECLECGKLVQTDSHPGTCPRCGGGFQDRSMSLE